MTNLSGRDFRHPSYSAGNQRQAQQHHQTSTFQRNSSLDVDPTGIVQNRGMSNSYQSMSQFQRSQQHQMQRQGSGSSTSMLFSGNGTGMVQSRQAGRISINSGSMAGRSGVMRYSTSSQSSIAR